MKPRVLIHFLALSLAACGRGQPCPTCDDDAADDDQPADMAEELPDLPCDGADLQNDDQNCGTCGNICYARGAGEYETVGCIDGVCGPTWFGQEWPEPTPLTCDDVCATSLLSCHTNACVGLTGFVCESILGESCQALGNGAGNLLLDLSGPCDESIPWPEVIYGGDRLVFCCCG